ncbi:MAG: hypothetical protein IPO90_12980 [Flavobacteriales bacterium]|nr:hypothetical protein [Flavobacteriales bacterium]
MYIYDEDKAASLRARGFTTVVAHRMDGIARGTSCTVSLTGLTANEDVISPRTSAQFSFRKGTSKEAYPNSLTGSIALLRQTLYEARWYSAAGKLEQSDADLQALNDQLNLPLVFEASNRNDVLRISSIAREFGFAASLKEAVTSTLAFADILAGLIVRSSCPSPSSGSLRCGRSFRSVGSKSCQTQTLGIGSHQCTAHR